MANINEEGLYGNLIPSIYIDKIVLENSGFYPEVENPHIQSDLEKSAITESSSLSVTITLSIKEKYNPEVTGRNNSITNKSWASSIDFQKYLKAKIVEVRDARVSNLLTLSKDFFYLEDVYSRVTDINLARIARNYIGQDIIRVFGRKKQFSLYNNNEEEVVTNIETLDDGTQILNRKYKHTFTYRRSTLPHLAYYCSCYLDYESIIKDFQLKDDLAMRLFLSKSSNIVGEIVFDGSEISRQTDIFLDENSKIWTGPIHLVGEDEYRTGKPGSENSRPLTKRTLANSVIQDFRRRQFLEKTNFNFSSIRNYFQKLVKVNSFSDNIKAQNSFFGDIDITTDANKSAKLKFSIALKDLLLSNSKVANIVQDRDSRLTTEVAKKMSIKSLKLYRKRVKKQNSNNSEITYASTYVPFSKNEYNQTIFHVSNLDKNSTDVQNVPVRIINTTTYPDVVDITTVDNTVSELSDGFYQYSIEILIDDPFVLKLEEIVEQLQAARNDLLEYKTEAEKPKNYDLVTNSFSEAFKRDIKRKYASVTEYPWVICSTIYASKLSLLIEEIERDSLVIELVKFSSPETGTVEGISFVISLIENLITEIYRILGKTEQKNNTNKSSSPTKTNNTFLISHTFENDVFDANFENQATFEYLNIGEQKENINGLLGITAKEYFDLVDREASKFWNTREPSATSRGGLEDITDLGLSTSYDSFLTPSAIIVNEETIDLVPTNDQRQISRINNAITIATSKKTSIQVHLDNLAKEGYDLTLMNLEMQQKYSLTITPFDIELPPVEPPVEPPVRQLIETKFVSEPEQERSVKIRPESSRNIFDISTDTRVIKGGISDFVSVFGTEIADINKPIDTRRIRTNVNERITEIEKNALPSQVRAVLSEDAGKNIKIDTIPEKNLKNNKYVNTQEALNLGSVKGMQILTGYEKGENNETLIKNPKWENITKEKIASLPNDKEVVCRLVDFKNKEIPVDDVTKTGKVANSTFTIRGNAPPQQLEEETVIANVKDKTVEIERETLNAAVKAAVEQEVYPAAATKTATVPENTLEETVSAPAVKKAIEEKQSEIVKESKKVPKAKSRARPKVRTSNIRNRRRR